MASVHRAFEQLQELLEEEEKEKHPWELYTDGQELCKKRAKLGPCTSGCTFRLFTKKRKLDNKYYCTIHGRVHICGRQCKEKIINHENWSCPFTGEVIEEDIFAEDKNSVANVCRKDSTTCSSDGDQFSDKMRAVYERVKLAMEEVSTMCELAISNSQWTKASFVKALLDFFFLLKRNTDLFQNQAIITKKCAMQFGLACAYQQRQGLTINNVVLFHCDKNFQEYLPRTHALIKKGIKVKAITRTQDLIKQYLNKGITECTEVDWSFPKPA